MKKDPQTIVKSMAGHSEHPTTQNRHPKGYSRLILELCDALNQNGIRYCHWKSNANIEKTLQGDGDLDLLVHRQDNQRFNQILTTLGFKSAEVPASRVIPGIRDYFGYDPDLQDFVHVHAHFQMIIGHDATKRIHLNIEEDYLNSAKKIGLIKRPSIEFEYVLFVIRMVFKHMTWDAFLRLESRFNKNELFEFEWMKERISQETVDTILSSNFPMVNHEDFNYCAKILSSKKLGLMQIKPTQRLANQLSMFSRINPIQSIMLKMLYRLNEFIRHRIIRKRLAKKLTTGGLFVAIVGGDGSGKTTLITSLYPWLNQVFDTLRVHLGKPRWSVLTILIRSFLKIFRLAGSQPFLQAPLIYTTESQKIRFPGYPWAIREVCTARDRYLTYKKARRFATNGGIVISDRFPLPQIHFMDGPQIERMYSNNKKGRFIDWLIKQENKYYEYLQRPDLMIVLKADPAISVGRKVEEDREGVWARANEIWTQTWEYPNVNVIDASLSKDEVLNRVKSVIWSYL